MKKIAICYSGQPRDISHTRESHEKYLYEINRKNYDIDTFAHIWLHNDAADKERNAIMSYINPTVFAFEEPKYFDTKLVPDYRFPHPIQNTLSMFYSINSVSNMQNKYAMENNITYDFVVRIRTDIFFKGSIGCLDDYCPEVIQIARDTAPHTDYAIPDQFAFSNQHNMQKYSEVYPNIEKIVAQNCAVNPECLLGFNLRMHNIKSNYNDWNICLWRHIH